MRLLPEAENGQQSFVDAPLLHGGGGWLAPLLSLLLSLVPSSAVTARCPARTDGCAVPGVQSFVLPGRSRSL